MNHQELAAAIREQGIVSGDSVAITVKGGHTISSFCQFARLEEASLVYKLPATSGMLFDLMRGANMVDHQIEDLSQIVSIHKQSEGSPHGAP